jgi:hypothetical protein
MNQEHTVAQVKRPYLKRARNYLAHPSVDIYETLRRSCFMPISLGKEGGHQH